MFHTPEYTDNVSLRLSKVLDEIGVNEQTVTKRRRTCLIKECLSTLTNRICGADETIFNFGSQTEGTTTIGLQSDKDLLVCNDNFNIIQDFKDWRPGFTNLLMVRDDNTPPGYCLLQKTYEDVPLPVDYAPNKKFVLDERGRVLMRNTWFADNLPEGCIRHGPSQTTIGGPDFVDQDLVYAYHCKSWPADATPWLHREAVGDWPSKEMKQSAVNDGCFVVPVGSRGSLDDEFQWRISTSLTERTLMFSLNITQIRCYVLMKMILKSCDHLQSEHTLSTFICKTIVLQCIENTHAHFWQENNLLSCLNECLLMLYNCVYLENCSHFIIPGNNLLHERISSAVKSVVLDIILQFILSEGRALLEIETDQLGHRLSSQFSMLQLTPPPFASGQFREFCTSPQPAANLNLFVSGQLLHDFTLFLSARNYDVLSELACRCSEFTVAILLQSIHLLAGIYNEGNESLQIACKLLTKFLYTSLGSILASESISIDRTLPQDALVCFSTDLTTDISSRLKLASLFYSIGDGQRTEFILRDTEDRYNLETVFSVCGCREYRSRPNADFNDLCALNDEETVVNSVAFCVRYLPSEINCIPKELQHELSRSEFDNRPTDRDYWMDWAVMDSIPYFYFLQYKVYSHLGNPEKKCRVLANLAWIIDNDPNLGHTETALNVLGQCLEQENRLRDALDCYTQSSNLRPTHNAANIYICQVLSKMYSNE